MRYNTKSALIGRMGKRDEEGRSPVFVHLFNANDPHKSDMVPVKFLEYETIQKIVLTGLDICYLIGGSDMLINDLEYIEIELEHGKPEHLLITGKQR